MEKKRERANSLSLNDGARRAKIIETCHQLFTGIAEKSIQQDVFCDFKSSLQIVENHGDLANVLPGSTHVDSSFRFPQKPIEKLTLLEREAELERTELKTKKEQKRAKVLQQEKSFSTSVDYQNIFSNSSKYNGIE